MSTVAMLPTACWLYSLKCNFFSPRLIRLCVLSWSFAAATAYLDYLFAIAAALTTVPRPSPSPHVTYNNPFEDLRVPYRPLGGMMRSRW